MKFSKKYAVVAALVLALGAAVYLNWQFSDNTSMLSSASKELGAATRVSTDVATDDEALSVSKSLSKSDEYFAKAQSDRTQAQDKSLTAAKEILQMADSSDEAKAEAVEQANALEERITAQSNIESILQAKGFTRCLCFISDEGCTVAVLSGELKDASALIIKDTVMSQYEIDFNDITIVEV